MGFEPTTFSLARRRTTTVLRPQNLVLSFLTESAETQDRTGDTAIFSRVLYQLSYLGQIFICKASVILLGDIGIVKQGLIMSLPAGSKPGRRAIFG